MSSAAWAELAPAGASSERAAAWVTLGDRQLALCSDSKQASRSEENEGGKASEGPGMRHSQPLVPSARDLLGWA